MTRLPPESTLELTMPIPARRPWRPRLAAALTVTALCVSGLCVSEATAAAVEPVRGVAPEQQAAFEAFECVVDGKSVALPREQLNDDYCDCDDGKDEPGTAACSHIATSVFHCNNDGYFPRKIHTSAVNDGICDCCDGSDEYFSNACANTCTNEAAAYRKEAEEQLAVVEKGFAERQRVLEKEIIPYFGGVNDAESSANQLLASLVALKERIEVYKAREELLETKLRVQLAREKQANQEESGKTIDDDAEETTNTPAVECANDDAGVDCNREGGTKDFDGIDAGDLVLESEQDIAVDARTSELLDTVGTRVSSMIDLPDGTQVTLSEFFRMERYQKPATKLRVQRTAEQRRQQDFLGPLFNGGYEERKQIGIYALRAVGIVLSPVRAIVELVLFIPNTLWKVFSSMGAFDSLPAFPAPTRSIWFRSLAGGEVYKAYTGVVWGARIVWDAPVFSYRYLFPELDDGVTLPVASSLRKVLAEIDADIAKLEKERDNKIEAASKDFGPDRAFFALKDKCIEKKIEKYKYKFCAFNEVKQTNTRLGKWDRWGSTEGAGDASASVDHSKMHFSKGQRCWNGPERSVEVHLECGAEDDIVSVDEPSTCIYHMVVRTPFACSAKELASARDAVAFWSRA